MKKVIVLLMLPILGIAQGIQFENSSWNELLEKAKSENKMIFVDAYTTWCGPCKLMDKNVFTNNAVGVFYNANFVNAKIDMRKGEGMEIAAKYAVNNYPTYLFIDKNGNLLHRVLGYMAAKSFIALGGIKLKVHPNDAETVRKILKKLQDEPNLKIV